MWRGWGRMGGREREGRERRLLSLVMDEIGNRESDDVMMAVVQRW